MLATMIATAPVVTAPTALIASFMCHLRSWWCSQWITIPACDSVKQMNTPTAKSGMRACVLPPKTMTSAIARRPMTMIPFEYASLRPRWLN